MRVLFYVAEADDNMNFFCVNYLGWRNCLISRHVTKLLDQTLNRFKAGPKIALDRIRYDVPSPVSFPRR